MAALMLLGGECRLSIASFGLLVLLMLRQKCFIEGVYIYLHLLLKQAIFLSL